MTSLNTEWGRDAPSRHSWASMSQAQHSTGYTSYLNNIVIISSPSSTSSSIIAMLTLCQSNSPSFNLQILPASSLLQRWEYWDLGRWGMEEHIICSVCWFPRCKYYYGRLQPMNVASLNECSVRKRWEVTKYYIVIPPYGYNRPGQPQEHR